VPGWHALTLLLPNLQRTLPTVKFYLCFLAAACRHVGWVVHKEGDGLVGLQQGRCRWGLGLQFVGFCANAR